MLNERRFTSYDKSHGYHAWVLAIQLFFSMLLAASFYYYLWLYSSTEIPNGMISYFHAMLGIFITASSLMAAIYFYQWRQVALQGVLCVCLLMEGLLLVSPIIWSTVFKHPLVTSFNSFI